MKSFSLLLRVCVVAVISMLFFRSHSNSQSVNLQLDNYTLQLPEGVVKFDVDKTRMVIKYNEAISNEQIQEHLISKGIFKPYNKTWKVPFPDLIVAELNEFGLQKDFGALLQTIQSDSVVAYTSPAVIYHGLPQYVYDLFYVKANTISELGILKRYAQMLGFTIREEHMPGVYFCRVNKLSQGNAFEIAKYLHSLNVFEFAEPDFVYTCNPATNDPNYADQWALNNTGQYNGTAGSDVEAVNAWNTTTGATTIKTAIIDCFGSTAQFTHPDISFFATYDATGTGFNSSGYNGDAHGICCAGIVAATGNNSAGGVGVAYTSKVIAVKVGTIINSSGSWNSTGTSISDGITWAYQNADVISNSNTFGSSSSIINTAISNSITLGRSGKGTPFFSSAGNSNSTTLGYPASYVNAIAVAASSPCDQRKSTSSCDGETWWGSDYGTGLDIAAPGVKMFTTDLTGSAGYSSTDYAATFNGTSSACPMAAGVMALVLSANPNLSYTSARYTLESTCEKVGGYTYNANVSGQPNGTWTSQLGYGRINAYQAVVAANCTTTITPTVTVSTNPSNTICNGTNVTFTATATNGGVSPVYQWKLNGVNVGTGVNTYSNNTLANGDQVSVVMTSSSACASPSSATSGTITMNVTTAVLGTVTATPGSVCSSGTSVLQSQLPYCTPTTSCTFPDIISNVTFGSINRTSTCDNSSSGFSLFTSPNPTYNAGTSYTLSVTTSGDLEGTAVWIDYNKDGTFQTSEKVMNGFTGTNPATYTTAVTIPSTAFNGQTRMRVRCIYNADPTTLAIPPCTNTTYGETEDYVITIAGGTANSTSYTWSPTTFLSSSTTNPTNAVNITASTTYTITASNGGCSATGTATVLVNGPSIAFTSTSPTCFNGSNGSINTNVSGGVSPYTYQWNNGATTQNLAGIIAGTYTVSVSDANGCTSSPNTTLTQPSAIAAYIGSENVSCYGASNGYAFAQPYGGTSPYAMLWSNGGTGYSISSLPAGTYTITITDANGCTGSASTTITEPASVDPEIDATYSTSNCTLTPATLAVVGTYTAYLWSTGETTQSITAYDWGTYHVTVTASGGCTGATSLDIPTIPPPPPPDIMVQDLVCGSQSATLSTNVNYQNYLWSNGATTSSTTVTEPGWYGLTITLQGECEAYNDTVITFISGVTLSVTGTNPSCGNTQNGTAAANASVAPSPYSYQWNTGGTTSTLTDLTAGTYIVTVTSSNGCTASGSVTLIQPTTTALSQPGTITVSGGSAAVCPGDVRTYTIASVTNATSYTWTAPTGGTVTSGQGTTSATVTYNNGFTATGTLIVVAVNACTTSVARTLSVSRNNPAMPSVITGQSTAVCTNTIKSYSVTNVSGMTYVWSTSTTNATISSGQGGNAVTVTFGGAFTSTTLSVKAQNACGLSSARTLAIGSVPSQPSVITGQSTGVCANTVKTYSVTNVAGVSYSWSTSTTNAAITSGQGTNAITVTYNGSFTTGVLTVIGSNGCGASAARTLSILSVPAISASITVSGGNAAVCPGDSRTYTAAVVTSATLYNWTVPTGATITSGQGTNVINVLYDAAFGTSGTISVTATNSCGTGSAKTLTVNRYTASQPSVITGQSSAVCANTVKNYSVTNVSGMTYTWSCSSTNATVTGGQGANAVTVTFNSYFTSCVLSVTATYNCATSIARTLSITSNPSQPSNIIGQATGNCNATYAYSVPAVSGVSSYTWSTNIAGATLVQGAAPGNTVTITWPQFSSGLLSVTPSNSCGTGTTRTRTVYGYTVAPTTITGSASVCANTDHTYSSNALVGASSYLWTIPTGATFVGANNTQTVTVHFGTVGGNITVSGVNACGNSSPKTLAVSMTCRMEEADLKTLQLYPNPTSQQVHIVIPTFEGNGELTLINELGQMQKTIDIDAAELNKASEIILDVGDLAAGMYHVIFRTRDEMESVRFVKQ